MHVVIVAFAVEGKTPLDAEKNLMDVLPMTQDHMSTIGRRPESSHIDCWWFAEDGERACGSDNESAVFIPEGSDITQGEARQLLEVEALRRKINA